MCSVIQLVGHVHSAFVVAEWVNHRHHMKLLEEVQAGVREDCPNKYDPESGGPVWAGDGSAS